MTAATAPALAADLDAGLRRLKPGTMRRTAAELMVTAKTQRWSPEEFLRTLPEAEITSRDESSARARMKAAAFPVLKTIAEFDVAASSIPQATSGCLASLEWVRAAENYCAVGPVVIRRLNFSAACSPRSGHCCDRCDDVRWLRAAGSSRAG
jgi:DNA replication protein DnaC